MITSRRNFMKAGTIAGLSIVVPALNKTAFGQSSKTPTPTRNPPSPVNPPDNLAQLRQEDFARCLYTYFQIRLSKRTALEVELCAITENKMRELFENFVLVFRGVHDTQLRQGTYSFEHTHLGNIEIFIVPAGSEANMRYYTAVFFRIDE